MTCRRLCFVGCMQEPHAISLHLSEALTLSTALLLSSRQGHLAAFGSAQLLLFEYPPRWSSITAGNRLRTGSKNMQEIPPVHIRQIRMQLIQFSLLLECTVLQLDHYLARPCNMIAAGRMCSHVLAARTSLSAGAPSFGDSGKIYLVRLAQLSRRSTYRASCRIHSLPTVRAAQIAQKEEGQFRPPQMQETHPGKEHEMEPNPSYIRPAYKPAGKLEVLCMGLGYSFHCIALIAFSM